MDAYRSFLSEIGYLVPEGGDFEVATADIDPELSAIAGPQLVVLLTNARYALNAANARWGSLYYALCCTDAIPPPIPWKTANLSGGRSHRLSDPAKFAEYVGDAAAPTSILISNHALHVEIVTNRDGPIGRDDTAGSDDVLLDSAVTTIMDCEDSVATVDGEDKVLVYRNWLGLMRRNLTASFEKGGETVARRLNEDRRYNAPDGSECVCPVVAPCWSAMSATS